MQSILWSKCHLAIDSLSSKVPLFISIDYVSVGIGVNPAGGLGYRDSPDFLGGVLGVVGSP